MERIQYLHDDPMVISLNIANYDVKHVLVDSRSFVDVLFYDALLKKNISPMPLKGKCGPLSRFLGELEPIEGTIILSVIVGQAPRWSLVHLTFMIIKASSAYNAIFDSQDKMPSM